MEVAPASTTSAAPAAAPAAAAEGAAAHSTPPQVTVSSGAPGTSSKGEPAAGASAAGASAGKWYDSFDADTKDYLTQKGFNEPKAVVESYRNLEKLRGVPQERLLKLPDPTAGADAPEWKDVFAKLGTPATPEGYGISPKDPSNAGFTNWAKDTFHKMNLTTTQGQELIKQFNTFNEAQQAQVNAQHTAKVQEQVGKLKQEWGAAHDQNLARAQAAYRQFGIPDAAIDSLEKSIGFDGVMKMFHKLGTQVGEHDFVNGGGGNQSFGEGTILTPEQANARIKALKQDSAWASNYVKGGVKERAEMERLMKMANPT